MYIITCCLSFLCKQQICCFCKIVYLKANKSGAVVVAQLVERLLPIPEICSSNPVIGQKLYRTFTINCIEKMKIMKKRLGMAHF